MVDVVGAEVIVAVMRISLMPVTAEQIGTTPHSRLPH